MKYLKTAGVKYNLSKYMYVPRLQRALDKAQRQLCSLRQLCLNRLALAGPISFMTSLP